MMETKTNQPRRSMRLEGVTRTYNEATTPEERKESRKRQPAKKKGRKEISKDVSKKDSTLGKNNAVSQLEDTITNVVDQINANENAAAEIQRPAASKFTEKGGLSASHEDFIQDICDIV